MSISKQTGQEAFWSRTREVVESRLARGLIAAAVIVFVLVRLAVVDFHVEAYEPMLVLMALLILMQGSERKSRADAASFAALEEKIQAQGVELVAVREIVTRFSSLVIHDTFDDFYANLRRAVCGAQNDVQTSYMRRYSPERLGQEAEHYFKAAAEWARGPGHHMRRVVCTPDDDQKLLVWLEKQVELAAAPHSNYAIRVVNWLVRDVDALSIAVIDHQEVFCAFSGEEDRLFGFSIRSSELGRYFERYLERLWDSAEDPVKVISRIRQG